MTTPLCWHCSRAIVWRGGQWVHTHNLRPTCYAPNGDARLATSRPDPCTVCFRGFSLDEWENRHTNPDDGVTDIHESCCRECEKLPTMRSVDDDT